MLYRLLKVARKAKGEQDYSEIESVSCKALSHSF